MKRNDLLDYLEDYLQIKSFSDYAPNGLQVEGAENIKRVLFAVSCTRESIKKAIELGVDTLIVHHGIFWKHQGAKPITGPHGERVSALIKNNLNLLSYHLPLDAHHEVGNAVALTKLLQLESVLPFGEYQRMPLGMQGVFSSPLKAIELKTKLEGILRHSVLMATPNEQSLIKSIGIITGGANNDWPQASRLGLDAYLTGEMSEYNWHDAIEAGLTYFAGGHNATEQFGVQLLQKHLEQKFALETFFFSSENLA